MVSWALGYVLQRVFFERVREHLIYFHFSSSLSRSHLPVKDLKIIKGFIIFHLCRELLIDILGRQRYSLGFMTYPESGSEPGSGQSSPRFVGPTPEAEMPKTMLSKRIKILKNIRYFLSGKAEP